ncbi:MAG: family 43 glycosylhydrolase [Acidimicrobiales bacterium]
MTDSHPTIRPLAARPRRPAPVLASSIRPVVLVVALSALLAALLAACSADPPAAVRPGTSTGGTSARSQPTVPQGPPATMPPAHGNAADPATIVTSGRNLPDPDVIKVPGGYQLYASQTGVGTLRIATAFTTNLRHWPVAHSAVAFVPPWAVNGFLWSPDVRFVAGQYVMYFDSLVPATVWDSPGQTGLGHYAQCIGLAVAHHPGGPFFGTSFPLVCDFAAHGAIDPRTFVAADGTLWLDWKSDTNANTPAPYSPSTIYAQQLAPNGLALAGPRHKLMTADASWQLGITEAPDMVEIQGRFWLFYSGSWFNQPTYGIGIASCDGPAGPCHDLSTNGPWLGSNDQGDGPGEESVLEDRAGNWWLLYSPWADGWDSRTYRPVAMALLGFGASGPYVAKAPSA